MSILALATLASLPAHAEITTQYGINFSRIGSPGNRNTLPHEVPLTPDRVVGAVAYEYRMATTEVTTSQWLQFVNAYAPYWQGSPSSTGFTSFWIQPSGGTYVIEPGTEHWPVEVEWRVAARYANWLHNGQATNREAFETGAYDTSTFGEDPLGNATDQRHHSPNARFWLPTENEWVKAVYYDPDRHGPGQEGYWLNPGGSDETLISGMPGVPGAQTNAGMGVPGSVPGLPVGSYPETSAPWQVLDASGGVSEWLETFPGEALGWSPNARLAAGSYMRSPGYELRDRLDMDAPPVMIGSLQGVRLAAAVPTPCSLAMLFTTLAFTRRKRP